MFSKFFINRPIFATVLALLIVVAGLVTLNILPVAQFPEITPPTVQVSAVYPGANAETVAQTVGIPIEQQVNGAFDEMEKRLALVGLTFENVVQMDCLFRDIWDIPVMEKVIKERFGGKYPVRKSIQTEFAHIGGENGLKFQADAVAYCK